MNYTALFAFLISIFVLFVLVYSHRHDPIHPDPPKEKLYVMGDFFYLKHTDRIYITDIQYVGMKMGPLFKFVKHYEDVFSSYDKDIFIKIKSDKIHIFGTDMNTINSFLEKNSMLEFVPTSIIGVSETRFKNLEKDLESEDLIEDIMES